MEERERNELVADLVDALEQRGAPAGMQLADLLRVETELVDALSVVRRQIDLIVRSARPEPPAG